jgi:hypothetical protein
MHLAHPRKLPRKIAGYLVAPFRARREPEAVSTGAALPIWLYRPETAGAPELPAHIPGMEVRSSWEAIVEAVQREQSGQENLDVAVYPSAGLLWLR